MGFLWPSPAFVHLQRTAFPDRFFDVEHMTLWMPSIPPSVELNSNDLHEIKWTEIIRCLPRLRSISLPHFRHFRRDADIRQNDT
jgi:hypothetical protein